MLAFSSTLPKFLRASDDNGAVFVKRYTRKMLACYFSRSKVRSAAVDKIDFILPTTHPIVVFRVHNTFRVPLLAYTHRTPVTNPDKSFYLSRVGFEEDPLTIL